MRSDTAVRQLFVTKTGLDLFTVSFPVYAASEISVKVQSGSEAERTLVLGTDYRVDEMSSSGGAYVQLLQSVGEGATVCVMSMLPYAQELSLGTMTAIRPVTLETQMDRTAQQIQQLAQSLERKVGIADTSSGTVPETDWFESQVAAASGYASAAEASISSHCGSAAAAVSAYCASSTASVSAYCSSAVEAAGSGCSAYVLAASSYADAASGAVIGVTTDWADMQQGTVTASSAISANTNIHVPSGMSYTVGKHHLMVAVGGILADTNKIIEVGSSGDVSFNFQLAFDVASGQEIHVMAGSLGGVPSMSGQSGKVLVTDGSGLEWNNLGTVPALSGQSGKYLTNDGEETSWGMVDVSGSIASHNADSSAHGDIRSSLSGKTDSAYVSSYVSSYVSGETAGLVSSSAMSSYVSGATSGLASSASVSSHVSSYVSAHDASSSAHGDIRTAISAVLPSQSGQSGKFLTTNGTSPSWGEVVTMASVTDTTSTIIALQTAAANTNYTYGELTSLGVGFSSSGTANDEIHIMFKSGTTATTLSVEGTNALFSSFTPNASSVVEIDARYYPPLSKWIVLFSQVAAS